MRTRIELIAELQHATESVVRPLIRPDQPVALLDFPSYPNVGDSAIWLGQLSWLRRWRRKYPEYTCDLHTYHPDRMARRTGRGTILLSGGGNLGDLYEQHQRFRESVIAAFPHNRIVQLAQTMLFRSTAALARARTVFNAHRDLTLLVRDRRSYEIAANSFSVPVMLCPDLAFGLGPLARSRSAEEAELRLLRRDFEATSPRLAEIDGIDWPESEPPTLAARLSRRLRSRQWPRRIRTALLARLYEILARQRLQRGIRLLERAEMVLTDRLHAHIICLLLGIPHTVRADRFGKVHDFVATWTEDCDLVHIEAAA